MINRLQVTILHELPGRLRVRLSHALRDAKGYGSALQTHSGIQPIRYNAHIRTVLVHFEPGQIQREELLVRMALAFSLEHGCLPVRIRKETAGGSLNAAEALSAGVLLAAGVGRGLGMEAPLQRKLEYAAGGLTGGAILLHGLREMRAAGIFHPELLSLWYLGFGVLRGRAFQAAVFTWFTAFGRHLMEVGEPAVQIHPGKALDGSGVVISAVPASLSQAFLRLLPAVLRFMQQAGKPLDDMLANLRQISKSHDDVLDALGPWKRGIPMQFTGSP